MNCNLNELRIFNCTFWHLDYNEQLPLWAPSSKLSPRTLSSKLEHILKMRVKAHPWKRPFSSYDMMGVQGLALLCFRNKDVFMFRGKKKKSATSTQFWIRANFLTAPLCINLWITEHAHTLHYNQILNVNSPSHIHFLSFSALSSSGSSKIRESALEVSQLLAVVLKQDSFLRAPCWLFSFLTIVSFTELH